LPIGTVSIRSRKLRDPRERQISKADISYCGFSVLLLIYTKLLYLLVFTVKHLFNSFVYSSSPNLCRMTSSYYLLVQADPAVDLFPCLEGNTNTCPNAEVFEKNTS